MLVLYVDDILVASDNQAELTEIKANLRRVLEVIDLGEPETYSNLSIKINRENKMLKITQPEHIEKILDKFKMSESKLQTTPTVTKQVSNRIGKRKDESTVLDDSEQKINVPFREAIGSLLFLAGSTRPDIAFAVNYLAIEQLNPSERDRKEVKRVFKYFKGTTNLGLAFRAELEGLKATTEESFRDWEDSTSTSGYVIKLFEDPIA